MFKIFLASTDKVFSKKIKKIVPDTLELSYGNMVYEYDKINEALAGKANIVFIDFHDIHFLRDTLPKATVIIASDTYDLKKEYLSARLGAKGFITKDIKPHSFKKAIEKVNSCQFWMTRSVATMIFREYGSLIRM